MQQPYGVYHPMTILWTNISLGLISPDSCTKKSETNFKGGECHWVWLYVNTLLLPSTGRIFSVYDKKKV